MKGHRLATLDGPHCALLDVIMLHNHLAFDNKWWMVRHAAYID
jgi:hypothetical protein